VLPFSGELYFRYIVDLTHDSLRMITASVVSQVSHGNQNSSANPSGRQSAVRYQVIQAALADGKELSRLFAAYQQLCVRRDDDSLRLLLAYTVDCSHWSIP
jgi:hypothetical protein